MKAGLIGKVHIYNEGSSTLELIISFSVLILTMTAVLLIAFGNQSNTLYADLNQEALYKANRVLEDTRADAKENYLSVVTESYSPESIYSLAREVIDLTPCKKRATARVTWQVDVGRPQKVELTNEFVDIPGALALGGGCLEEPPDDDWTNPLTFLSRDLNYKAAAGDISTVNSSSGNQSTDIAVRDRIIYMTAGLSVPSSKDDFFILDARHIVLGDPNSINIVGRADTGTGLEAIAVASTSPTKAYAFVANNEEEDANQLRVIDISNISNPVEVAQLTLPGVVGTCPSACPGGRSIYYYDHKVYLGIHYIIGGIAEFHEIDVSDPTTPIWEWSYNIDNNVNKIVVRDQIIAGVTHRFAYIASSDNSGELTILDITNLASVYEYRFDAVGDEDGRSVYIIGNIAYLGRNETPAVSGRPNILSINISDPTAPALLDGERLPINSSGPNPAYISGVRVLGKFGFIGEDDPNEGFRVMNILTPTDISTISTYNFSQKTTGIDFDGKYIYTSNESNDAVRIIYDVP